MNRICIVVLLFFGLSLAQDQETWPLVTVAQGQVRGKLSQSRDGKEFTSFLGIPYAKVTKRFQESEPADNWMGTRDATIAGSQCMQFSMVTKKVVGSEDCLFVNVHTFRVNESTTELLPVLVFIHGGGFLLGQSDICAPNFIMDENLVFVSFNYRLGAFGFLNAGTSSASGNMGFKDQILALKWVRDNISKFGGDPNQVTISGQGAGSMSVSLLVLSPLAKGLFAQAISQSGTGNTPAMYEAFSPPLKHVKKLAVNLDCPTSDVDYMVKCLQRMDPASIILASQAENPEDMIFSTPENTPPLFGFTVEDRNVSKNVLLSHWPSVLLQHGEIASKVPYILGINSHEGLTFHGATVFSNPKLHRRLSNEWGRYAPNAFVFERKSKDPCKVGSQVRFFYLGDKPLTYDNHSIDGITNLYTDVIYMTSTRETALAHSRVAPTYLYFFEKQGFSSFSDAVRWQSRIAPLKYPAHGDQIQYLYQSERLFPKLEDKDLDFSRNFVKLWTSFVRDGKPSDPAGVKWDTVDWKSKAPQWFHINQENQMKNETERISKAVEFWDQLGQWNFKKHL